MRTRLRISGYISDLLGLSLFSSDFKVFTASYALLLIGTTFSSLFISTFLFQINRDITTLAIYHIVYYACEAAVFYIALRLSHIISSVRYIIAGFVLYAAGIRFCSCSGIKVFIFIRLSRLLSRRGAGFTLRRILIAFSFTATAKTGSRRLRFTVFSQTLSRSPSPWYRALLL